MQQLFGQEKDLAVGLRKKEAPSSQNSHKGTIRKNQCPTCYQGQT